MPTTAISSKGQIVLPSEIRKQDKIHPGQLFEVEREGPGIYRLVAQQCPPNAGLLKWLLSCPEKDWFQRIPSDSTDHVKSPYGESISAP